MASGLAFALLILTISTNKHEPGAIGSIAQVHRTTQCIPMNRWVEEQLSPLPIDYAWERFGAEERRVSWDGFLSYDGVLYGLPAEPPVAGSVVQVRERELHLRVSSKGSLIATLTNVLVPRKSGSTPPNLVRCRRRPPRKTDNPLDITSRLPWWNPYSAEDDQLFSQEVAQ